MVFHAEERPSQEVLHILPLDLSRRSVPEPFLQIPLWIGDILMATPKEFPAMLTIGERRMICRSLEVGSVREKEEQVERCLESAPYRQQMREAKEGSGNQDIEQI